MTKLQIGQIILKIKKEQCPLCERNYKDEITRCSWARQSLQVTIDNVYYTLSYSKDKTYFPGYFFAHFLEEKRCISMEKREGN